MWDHEIRAMASTHAIIAASVFMATVLPAVFVRGFSVYGTHLLWIYSVSGAVTAVSVAVFWLLGITPPTKKHTPGYKVTEGSVAVADTRRLNWPRTGRVIFVTVL